MIRNTAKKEVGERVAISYKCPTKTDVRTRALSSAATF